MKSRLLHEDDGQRTFALIFETGDELMDQLERFAAQDKALAAHYQAMTARLDSIESAGRADAANLQRVEREILQLKAELPLNYVRREDYVQAVATIMAKLDAMTLRMENILLRGARNHE